MVEVAGAADGDAVWSVIVSGLVPSEVVSGYAGSARAGASDWLACAPLGSNAIDNAIPATAETTAVASAHAGTSTIMSITHNHPCVRSLRGSHRSTANAHRSTANKTNSAAVITIL